MNGYMNIQIRLQTGRANQQIAMLRKNLAQFEAMFKGIKKSSTGMSQVQIIGKNQIRNMQQGNVEGQRLNKMFIQLRGNMEKTAALQAKVANRQFVRADQVANIRAVSSELKVLNANLRVYQTLAATTAKTPILGGKAQTAGLARTNRLLETMMKSMAVIQAESIKTASTPMVGSAQTAEVNRLKTELQGLRRAMAATQAQAAKGAAVGAGSAVARPAGGGGGGMAASAAAAAGAAESANRSFDTAGRGLTRWGSQLQWAGRQLQYNFTLPILLAAGVGMKFALDQEKAFTHIKKVYGDAADAQAYFMKQGQSSTQAAASANRVFTQELASLDKYITVLSEHFAMNKTEVLEVAGAWAAAGASGRELAQSVRNTLFAAQIGDFSTVDATKALISVQSQYGMSAKELGRDLAYLNSVENATAVGMQDLIIAFRKSAGVARNGGIDVRHLAANIAALVPAAGTAAEAGNALKSIIASIMAPTKRAGDAMRGLGHDIDSKAWADLNAQERMLELSKSFEGLTESQKNTTATFIAGKWQVNRFTTLMRELRMENGWYAKALRATSSEEKSLATAAKELDVILKSNPASLKRVGVALQNNLAAIMAPLLPAVISLGTALANLLRGFQNLPDPIQKLVMYLAIFLVVMPLVTRYIGAMAVLFGYLRIAAVKAGAAFALFGGAMLTILKFPFMILARTWTVMMTAMGAATAWGWTVIKVIWAGGMVALRAMTIGGLIRINTYVVSSMAALGFIMSMSFKSIMKRIGTILLAAFASPWALAIAGVLALLYYFRNQIAAIWNNIVNSFDGGALRDMFNNLVRNIITAFNALPQGVQNALMAVVRIVQAAAKAVYSWFQYLNPWAKHSPSLVQNVQTGMRAIINEFSGLSKIQNYVDDAYRSLSTFGDATAKLMNKAASAQAAEDRGLIKKGAGASAAREYDVLIGKLKVLQRTYDGLGERIKAMENEIAGGIAVADEAIFQNEMATKRLRLEILKSAEAYGGFDNAKSKLEALNGEIEILKGTQTDLRNAGAGSEITSFYDQQIAALEGQKQGIEDNIGQVDQMSKALAALERQGEILSLQKDVDFGDQLHAIDLMNQKYQLVGSTIDDIKSKIQEVVSVQQQLDSAAEAKKNAAKSAGSASGAGRGAGRGGGAGGLGAGLPNGPKGSFAQVGGKGLAPRTDWSSQAADIDKMTDDLIAESAAKFGAINPFKGLWDWWLKTWDKIKNYVLPDFSAIGQEVFGGIDIGGAGDGIKAVFDKIKGWAQAFWDFFGPEIKFWADSIWKGLGEIWNLVGPALIQFGGDVLPFLQAFWNAFKMILAFVAPVVKLLLGLIGGALYPLLTAIGLVAAGIINILGGAFRVIGGVVNFIYHLLTGQFGKLGGDLGDIFFGAIHVVVGIFKTLGGLLMAVIGTPIGMIVGFFQSAWDLIVKGATWLYNALIGHSIIPDIVNGIIGFFKLLIAVPVWLIQNVLMPIFNAFVWVWNTLIMPAIRLWWAGFMMVLQIFATIGAWFFNNVLNPIFQAFLWVWNTLIMPYLMTWWALIQLAWAGLVLAGQWIWNNVLLPVWNFFKQVWNQIVAGLRQWWSWIQAAWGALKQAGVWFWNNVLQPVVTRFRNGINNIISVAKQVWGWLVSAWNKLKALGSWFWENVLKPIWDKFKELFNKLGDWIRDNVGKITNPFKAMINTVIRIINKMIDGLNMLSKLPGIEFKVSHIKQLAEGGEIPSQQRRVGAGFKTHGPRAIVGEGRQAHPEYVVPTDPRHRNRAMSLFQSLGQDLGVLEKNKKVAQDSTVRAQNARGIPEYAIGGILDELKKVGGSAKSVVKGIKNSVISVGGKTFDWATDHIGKAASFIYNPIGKIVDSMISKIGQPIEGGVRYAHGQIRDLVTATDKRVGEIQKAYGGKWSKPLKGGYRIGGGIGSYPGHNGRDFPVGTGSTVYAINGGKVTTSRDMATSYGRFISIKHPWGQSLYAHNQRRLVGAGATVRGGQPIAKSDSTGNSTGPHLHLSTWKGGRLVEPLNLLRSHGIRMGSGGIVKASMGGLPTTLGEAGRDELVTPLPNGFNPSDLVKNNREGDNINENHFHGDLIFPNVRTAEDAESLIENLRAITKA